MKTEKTRKELILEINNLQEIAREPLMEIERLNKIIKAKEITIRSLEQVNHARATAINNINNDRKKLQNIIDDLFSHSIFHFIKAKHLYKKDKNII